jgi:hypothetical protein
LAPAKIGASGYSHVVAENEREGEEFGCADLSKAFNGPDGMKPSGNLLGNDYTHPSGNGNGNGNGNGTISRVLAELGLAPLAWPAVGRRGNEAVWVQAASVSADPALPFASIGGTSA